MISNNTKEKNKILNNKQIKAKNKYKSVKTSLYFARVPNF